jgi:phosphate transport system substrate-binding protein
MQHRPVRNADHLMTDLTHPRLVAAIVVAIIVVVALWISISFSRWRRITWRDHMDTQMGSMPKEPRDSGPWAIWKVFTPHEEVAQPSMVLLRIRNSGFRSISRADMRRPLTFTFPGRAVKEFTITDCRGVLRQEIQPHGELNSPQDEENQISLARFPMRRRAGFKLLVLLSGAGRGIVVNGRLRHGRVLHESRLRGPVAQNVAFGSALLLLVGVQAGITFSQSPALPSYCASGKLALEGSTAFAPTAQQIGAEYTSVCHGAAISVSGIATFNGLNAVAAEGSPGPSGARSGATAAATAAPAAAGTTQMAMSDGPAPPGYPATLVGHPVAVILFAVVTNKKDNIYNLTTAQLRDIWQGKITNWDQLHGPDLAIKIVARTTASGTRRAFDQNILGGAEPPFSSYNCVTKNAVPAAKVIRCEVSDTDTLLQRVNSIPGAIGYAQISDASNYPNVAPIKINGWDASLGAVQMGSYRYWTVEYLYTAGTPAAGSLAADFLGYMDSVASDDILRTNEYTPCIDQTESLMKTLCGPEAQKQG